MLRKDTVQSSLLAESPRSRLQGTLGICRSEHSSGCGWSFLFWNFLSLELNITGHIAIGNSRHNSALEDSQSFKATQR